MKHIVTFSEIQLLFFGVEKAEFEWHHPEMEGDFEWNPADSTIAIGFDHFTNEAEPSELMVRMTVEINPGKDDKGGYQANLEAFGAFRLSEMDGMDEAKKHNLFYLTPVSMMIGLVRTAIQSITEYGTGGRFSLPAIDISQLLDAKAKEESVTKPKAKKPKRSQ